MAQGFDLPPMTEVRSSNIKAVGYDETTNELYIEFVHRDKFGHANRNTDGDVYRYYKVPKAVYTRLMSAASKGQYVWKHIRGRYRYMMKGRTGWRGPTNRAEGKGTSQRSRKR